MPRQSSATWSGLDRRFALLFRGKPPSPRSTCKSGDHNILNAVGTPPLRAAAAGRHPGAGCRSGFQSRCRGQCRRFEVLGEKA
ncbi:MAG: hypothetical protein ACLTY5_02895 [Angelakisella sp.]